MSVHVPRKSVNDITQPEAFANLRQDFPMLKTKMHGHPLVYLDSAASTLKPQDVITSISDFYTYQYANIHRGVYQLSADATQAYENMRELVKGFIHAPEKNEIIFVRGTTEAINLVARSYGDTYFQAGDEIILSIMEHHSNIVPWQMLAERKQLTLRFIPINEQGELNLDAYANLLSERTKLVAVTQASNALGTINPIKKITTMAHAVGAQVLVDGAQAVAHMPVDVQDLDCDFYAFSAHKMYGPTGVGVLYARSALLDKMPPYEGGGSMIRQVTCDKTTYADAPQKFEAGTPNIVGVIGLGAAIKYLQSLGMEGIMEHEQHLIADLLPALSRVPGLRLLGPQQKRIGVFSFVMEGVHAHDVGTVLDSSGIAIRAGHHCAMPLMQALKVVATARASLGVYNNAQDIAHLLDAIEQVQQLFVN